MGSYGTYASYADYALNATGNYSAKLDKSSYASYASYGINTTKAKSASYAVKSSYAAVSQSATIANKAGVAGSVDQATYSLNSTKTQAPSAARVGLADYSNFSTRTYWASYSNYVNVGELASYALKSTNSAFANVALYANEATYGSYIVAGSTDPAYGDGACFVMPTSASTQYTPYALRANEVLSGPALVTSYLNVRFGTNWSNYASCIPKPGPNGSIICTPGAFWIGIK